MRRSCAPSLLNKSNIANKSTSGPTDSPSTSSKVLAEQNPSDNSNNNTAYSILWAKRSAKKHKIWEGDGTLTVSSKFAILRDDTGKYLGQIPIRPDEIEIGNRLVIGSNEIEIIELIPISVVPKKRYSETTHILDGDDSIAASEQPSSKKIAINPSCFVPNLVLSNSMAIKCGFTIAAPQRPKRLLDANEPKTVTSVDCRMPEPNYEHQWKFNTTKQPIVEVSVCPSLAAVLRPHQRDGIRFMYECIMGFRNLENFGCILADEMGLGKTLQCIALCYTLLKQGPYGIPIARKILIVTPSSLITNWDNEIQKWLKHERTLFTYQIDAKHKVDQFAGSSQNMPFLLISYEMFTKHSESLKNVSFDLLICDEGHRLKNQNVKAAILLNEIECKRRIVLTGTPIQNDLQEFYALMSFVNANLLGTYNEYKRQYEMPIVAAQKSDVTPDVHELGECRAKELNCLTAPYILRRTQTIIEKFLPKKETLVVFCRPSQLQQKLFQSAMEYFQNDRITSNPLQAINVLKKICNHPSLIQTGSNANENSGLISYLREKLPEWNQMSPFDSGKLAVVYNLLDELDKRNEKIVLISYHTTTLDMLQGIIEHFNYKYCRLDGNTPAQMRGKIVDQFNDEKSDIFIFLLSAKAGGCGLNLIGASRLVMFDNDWNPASDIQAMSRIWRDGQKRDVYIYRLITMGTIEEKIFQRQLSKTTLSCSVVDTAATTRDCLKFSDEELKDLFSMQQQYQNELCATHELLSCECNGDGQNLNNSNSNVTQLSQPSSYKIDLQTKAKNSLKIDELSQWQHYKAPIQHELLTNLCLSNCDDEIYFIFRNQITK